MNNTKQRDKGFRTIAYGTTISNSISPNSNIINSERIQGQTEEFFENFLNLISKLEIPEVEVDAHQLIIESKCTDVLQRLVTFANENILRSFNLRLEMELATGSNGNVLRGEVR